MQVNIIDDMFWKQLELFFSLKEYQQKKAQLQIGFHGIAGVGGLRSTPSISEYKIFYEKLVKTILNYIPDLTIATSTHVVKKENLFQLDESINGEIIKKNDIAIKVAKKFNLNVNDLYTYMLEEGKGYKHVDTVHFEASSNDFIASKVASSLKLL